MEKTVKFTVNIDVKGDQMLKNITADSNDLKVSVENVNETLKDTKNALSDVVNKGLELKTIKDAFDVLAKGVETLANDFNTFDKGMRAVNTMAGLDEKELGALTHQKIESNGAEVIHKVTIMTVHHGSVHLLRLLQTHATKTICA